MVFSPAKTVLSRYSQVLIDFALGSGKGINKGEVILLQYDSPAVELALAVYKRILEKGAHALIKESNSDFAKLFFEKADLHQLQFFPEKYYQSLVESIDHKIYLIATKDPFYLQKASPQKISLHNQAQEKLKKWLFAKEDKGKLTWTLALFATEKMAQEAGMSVWQYWRQIERACFLTEKEPIKKWQNVFGQINQITNFLNRLPIDKIHLKAKNTDIVFSLGQKRVWQGGSGRNIPSFEIFTSPDWRGTNGYITFDLPLYRYGNLIKDIYLEFKNGRVVKARASKNQNLLRQIIKQKNANKVGEFSLTDKRFSKINKFMANTLYDENFGGRYGNTHLALGSSYHDCYQGQSRSLTDEDYQALGFNSSVEHTDIIAKSNRVVDVILKNKQKKTIYQNGSFVLS